MMVNTLMVKMKHGTGKVLLGRPFTIFNYNINWAVLEFRNFLKLLYLSNELNIKKTFNIGIETFNFDYTFIARKINKASPKKKTIALHFS